MIAFYAALVLLPESARSWIDRAFYVWLSVFALFVVTVFWGLVVDLFRDEQGKRLFGFIAVGSSLGGIVGSADHRLAGASMCRCSCCCCWRCCRSKPPAGSPAGSTAAPRRRPRTLNREPEATIGGGAWSGIVAVFRTPALRDIALWILLMTFASTILYFVQSHLVGEAISDRALRRAFLARIDLAVNVVTILTQAFLTARIAAAHRRRPDAGRAAGGGGTRLRSCSVRRRLRWRSPHCWWCACSTTAAATPWPSRRGKCCSPGWSREQRYKSKAFIDAAVYRGGDLLSGWIYAGLAALGLTVGGIALAAAPVAVAWAVLGRRLGRDG